MQARAVKPQRARFLIPAYKRDFSMPQADQIFCGKVSTTLAVGVKSGGGVRIRSVNHHIRDGILVQQLGGFLIGIGKSCQNEAVHVVFQQHIQIFPFLFRPVLRIAQDQIVIVPFCFFLRPFGQIGIIRVGHVGNEEPYNF